MAEVMLGKDLHPDRVISIEKLYEILNEHEIPCSFPAQYGIENNAFAVVRCKDCKHYKPMKPYPSYNGGVNYCCRCSYVKVTDNDFCSYGERKDNESH